jgi:3-hydroxyisobutyrate dehydrogenase-like beta-hydroxyacid dehydrogenase
MATLLGFIGLGSMGGPMARNLVAGGHRLVVHDLRDGAAEALTAAGARSASSARAVADAAEIVFTCVTNNDACHAAMLGETGIAGGSAARLVVNLGTTGSDFSRTLSRGLAKHAITLLDAPISGGAKGAKEATLAIMVSGARQEYERIEPILRCIGRSITFVSEQPGSAQTLKLANNLLSATAYAITTEALVMGAKAGLDPELMLNVINAGSGRNSATADKFPRAVLNREFDLGATFDIICKDLRLCAAEAEAFGVPMWVGNAVRHLFLCGSAEAGGGADLTRLVEHVEKQARTQIPKVR